MLFKKNVKVEENKEKAEKQKIVKSAYIKYIDKNRLRHIIPPSPVADGEIITMAQSIRSLGLLSPIRVYYDNALDEYSIISGERRFSAMSLLERSRVLCHVVTDIETRDAIILAEYCLSNPSDPFRSAAALEFLIKTRDYSISELVSKSGLPFNRINNLLKLNKLTWEERRLLLISQMTEAVCIEISELENNEVRKAVIDYLIKNRPNIKKIAELTKKAEKRSFGFNFKLIDNSISKLTGLIEKNGAKAEIAKQDLEGGISYTISVTK